MKKVLQKFSQFYKNLPIAKKMAATIIFILAFFLCTVTGLITVIFSKMLISNNSEASNRNLELVRLRMNDLFVNTEMNFWYCGIKLLYSKGFKHFKLLHTLSI